jgi:hypothetical protein
MIVATSERLTVWTRRGLPDDDETKKIAVECPHCGEEALLLELELSETPEVEIMENMSELRSQR